jgi:hypothetical protein
MTITLAKTLPYADTNERRIATAIVTDALAAGFTVSVHDGEEWALLKGNNKTLILLAMGSTDSDTLRLRDADDNIVGSITLIWGNGEDLLSDHSDTDAMNAFLEGKRYC